METEDELGRIGDAEKTCEGAAAWTFGLRQ